MLVAPPNSRAMQPRDTGAAVARIQCLLLLLLLLLSPTRSTAALGLVVLDAGETKVVRPTSSIGAWTTTSSSSSLSSAAFGAAVPSHRHRGRRRRHGSALQLESRAWGHRRVHRLHSSSLLSSNHIGGVTSPAEEDRQLSSMVTDATFEEQFGGAMPHWLLSRAEECGWTHPTSVQAEALHAIVRDNVTDLVLQAETGSGKTLAYLLPCLSRIDPTRSSLQAAVVVPTRELGLQVAKVARRLASGYYSAASSEGDSDDNNSNNNNNNNKKKKMLVMSVLQGSHNKRQRAWAWADPPHVVIGTPPELLDMVAKGGFKRFNSIRTLVVDEVDACLLHNMGSVAVAPSSSSSSSPGSGGSIQLAGTTLHELLSKHLSPTFVEGRTTSRHLGSDGDEATRRPVDRSRLTIFCSATIPQPRHFVRQCVQNQWMLNEPVHLRCRPLLGRVVIADGDDDDKSHDADDGDHDVQPPSSLMPSSLEHQYVVCADADQAFATLRRLLQRIHKSGSTSMESKKLLIFCDPRRPMRGMADIIGRDLERISSEAAAAGTDSDDESSTVPSTSSRSTRTRTRRAVVSVLSLEDNLSDRAAAMSAFRGDGNENYDSDPAGTHDEHDDDDRNDDNDDNDDNDWVDGDDEGAGALDSSHSPPRADAPTTTVTTTRILLSTDLAARGLDIVDITHVVHYDLPVNADAYVHRSGRAGRFGRPGRVLSIVPRPQEFALGRMLNKLQVRATCVGRQQPRKGRGT